MDAHTYPGKGLSPSQLVFALNEELKRVVYSPSFTSDVVSQLDRDTATALATIREWRNSFVPINRVPLDVLSLIPTHLDSQEDRFRASHVCRQWRRTFLQHAPLWSQLFLSKGKVYMKTLLERAKGSALDIITNSNDPVDALTLLPPYTRQIRYLNFGHNYWSEVRRFSEVHSGPLPLLRALRINAIEEFHVVEPPLNVIIPPSFPLFRGAVNLKRFVLHSERFPPLGHFVFPNLTTFELSTMREEFLASELLDFLEALPTLRKVDITIFAYIVLGEIPQERVVVLPNAETFFLVVSDGGPGYEIAAHILCPSARLTSLVHEQEPDNVIPGDIFPTSDLWNAIVRQYTRSPVEEVTLEIKTTPDSTVTCSLTFQSLDTTILRLGFEFSASDDVEDEYESEMLIEDVGYEVFYQASRAIQDHPLLPNVKRLHIKYRNIVSRSNLMICMANEIGGLFKSVGPLDELTIHSCDPRSYLPLLPDFTEFYDMEQLVVFPPVKEFTITHPPRSYDGARSITTIVGLAKSQHALGVPFERVTVCAEKLPAGMVEMLRPWVGAADCYEKRYTYE